MLFIDCDLFTVVGFFALDFIVKLNHKEESTAVTPYIVRIDKIMIDQVLTDARMLLDLERGVSLQSKWVK